MLARHRDTRPLLETARQLLTPRLSAVRGLRRRHHRTQLLQQPDPINPHTVIDALVGVGEQGPGALQRDAGRVPGPAVLLVVQVFDFTAQV